MTENTPTEPKDAEQKHYWLFNYSSINELISYEKQLRLEIDNKILQSRLGRMVNQVTAILAGASTFIYIALTYMETYHVHMRTWYDSTDKSICTLIMGLYASKVYVSQHRINEIFTVESLLNIIVFLPVLLIPID